MKIINLSNSMKFAFIILSIFLISCDSNEVEFTDELTNTSNSEINSEYDSAVIITEIKLSVNQRSNRVYKVPSTFVPRGRQVMHRAKNIFIPSKQMPYFKFEKDLKKYMLMYPERVYGRLDSFLDGILIYSTTIVEGEKYFEDIRRDGLVNKIYPCTYTGIKACAIDGIHGQNWRQMALCILEGGGCVVTWYIDCAIDNC